MNATPWLLWAFLLALFAAALTLVLAMGVIADRVEAKINERYRERLQRRLSREEVQL